MRARASGKGDKSRRVGDALKVDVVDPRYIVAVGVVVGGAFTAIVTALVNDIINPLISLIIGGLDFSGVTVGVFPIGDLIMAIINFLCISFVVFWMVKVINRFKRKKAEEVVEAAAAAEPSKEETLLAEIRDLLKAQTETGK